MRDQILGTLKKALGKETISRPEKPAVSEENLSPLEQIDLLIEKLTPLTDRLERVENNQKVLDKLSEIVNEENLHHIVTSSDHVVSPLNLPEWGEKTGVDITAADHVDPEKYKETVFRAQAGITGVDFAVAESGTLILTHSKDQARLVSLAPILHIVVVPLKSVVPVYEKAVEKIFSSHPLPSQVTWITGPSMTGDIQATLSRGMHGPKRLIIILVENP